MVNIKKEIHSEQLCFTKSNELKLLECPVVIDSINNSEILNGINISVI